MQQEPAEQEHAKEYAAAYVSPNNHCGYCRAAYHFPQIVAYGGYAEGADLINSEVANISTIYSFTVFPFIFQLVCDFVL